MLYALRLNPFMRTTDASVDDFVPSSIVNGRIVTRQSVLASALRIKLSYLASHGIHWQHPHCPCKLYYNNLVI
jgi:hypothetical protein